MKIFVGAVVAALLLVIAIQVARPGAEEASPEKNRIVSLAPNLTTILFDLGVGERVAGVTTYCDDPPEARTRPKIGDFINPNFELIVSLKPDLIVSEKWTSSKTVPRLRALGLRVEDLQPPRSIDEISVLIRSLGELVERADRAEELIASFQRRVQKVQARGASFPVHPRLYLEIDRPSWTVGGPSFSSQAIDFSGARNIFADTSQAAPLVSEEVIIQRNPEIIVSFAASAEEIRARPGWDRIDAVRRNRIIDDFAEAALSRGNHRLAEGMEQLQKRIEQVMDFPR